MRSGSNARKVGHGPLPSRYWQKSVGPYPRGNSFGSSAAKQGNEGRLSNTGSMAEHIADATPDRERRGGPGSWDREGCDGIQTVRGSIEGKRKTLPPTLGGECTAP